MRSRWTVTAVLAAALASAPLAAQGQDAGGTPSETQERLAQGSGDSNDLLWNLIGLIGLIGLRGLWRDSDNDGYTEDPV